MSNKKNDQESNQEYRGRLQKWKDTIDSLPEGFGASLIEPFWLVKQIFEKLWALHPHPQEGSKQPLTALVDLIESDAKKLLGGKSEEDLSRFPHDFDIESALGSIGIAKELKRKKLSKSAQEIAFLTAQLVSASIRMRVIDFVENEIQLRIGRKKAGRKKHGPEGIKKLIQKKLKESPSLTPRQIWIQLSKFDSRNPSKEIDDFEIFMDGENLYHVNKDGKTRHLKFDSFKKYVQEAKKKGKR